MGDPILGIKWFCLFVCISIMLMIIHKFLAGSRAIDHQFTMSNLEGVVIILRVVFMVLSVLSLLWSAVVWIIN